jgi:hypothetical protein
MGQHLRDEHGELDMIDIVEPLREAFQRRRYGEGSDYHPDFDLFDVAADEIVRLRAEVAQLHALAGGVSVEYFNYADFKRDLRMKSPKPDPNGEVS